MRIQVQRVDPTPRYWNQDRLQNKPAWIAALLRPTPLLSQVRWSIGDVDFSYDEQYIIRISAHDTAGNRRESSENRRYFFLVEYKADSTVVLAGTIDLFSQKQHPQYETRCTNPSVTTNAERSKRHTGASSGYLAPYCHTCSELEPNP